LATEVWVIVTFISSVVDPSEITNALGIQPVETWHKGETIPNQLRARTSHGWQLSRCEQSRDLTALIAETVQLLLPQVEGLRNLRQKGDVHGELKAVIYSDEAQGPYSVLSTALLGYLIELGLELEFQIYCLPEGSPANSGFVNLNHPGFDRDSGGWN
jgi:hypothetical protein